MLNHCLVTQLIGAIAPDSPIDDDREPDYLAVSGEVVFTPNMRQGDSYKITNLDGDVETAPAIKVVANIVNGRIEHEGQEGVLLFAAGDNSNPSRITYSVTYRNLSAEGYGIHLKGFSFEAIPNGKVDLGTVTPVAGTPGVGIVQGPRGPQGEKGDAGQDGSVVFESLTPEQVEQITGPQGPQGDIGPQGPRGELTEEDRTKVDEAVVAATRAKEGAEEGQELSEDAAAVAVAAAVGAAEATSDKAETSYVDAQDQALGQRITDEKWWRGTLGASDTLDDLRGTSAMGLYRVTTNAVGGPGLPGWVEVTYDSNSARTRQVFTASSPADSVSLERKYSGGRWRDWSPVTWHGVVVSSGSADDLRTPHVYAINSTSVADLPDNVQGSLEVLPAGSGSTTLIQRYTSRESPPRVWVRSRTGTTWADWTQFGDVQDDEPISKADRVSLTMETKEIPISGGSSVVQSMSNDGVVGYSALSPTLKQTFDKGTTWEEVQVFAGNNIEWARHLPSGELMVETTAWVDGESGVRRIWVSTGYDRHDPTAATWDVTLTAAARMVKFADWSISISEDMILLAEYGPKSGMVWGGGTEIIEEGKNARYIYKSTDGGYTWDTIFDLNTFLLAHGRETADRQHLHGVAWDKWWQRIWVTFGDASGDGSNGVFYSDDQGDTWEIAYWTHTHTSLGWQVVGIQPMEGCVLFAGDMTPSGFIGLDREQGRDSFEFHTAWIYSEEDKHLCHAITYQEDHLGELAMFAFAREGSASPSYIVGTRDGKNFDLLWVESGSNGLPGIRSLAGPFSDGTVIAAHNSSSGWVEVSGILQAHGVPWRDDAGGAALRELGGKADKAHTHTASQITDLHHYSGVGFPEGKVAAPVGAIYVDQAATAGAVRWIKTQGTGNTGWQVEYGNTGWRRLQPHGPYLTGDGDILLRRTNSAVYCRFVGVGVNEDVGNYTYLTDASFVPMGFRPEYAGRPLGIMSNPNANPSYLIGIAQGSRFRFQATIPSGPMPGTGGQAITGQFSWSTLQTWPTTLPGTPE